MAPRDFRGYRFKREDGYGDMLRPTGYSLTSVPHFFTTRRVDIPATPCKGASVMSVRRLLKGKGTFVPVIRSDLCLNDVVDQLEIDSVGALVVTDDNSKIKGIITERDIARGLKSHGRNVLDRPLSELMTDKVITVDVNEPLSSVLQLMDKHQIHYVPVTEDGSLCGIINMLDLVKYRLAELETEANAMKDYLGGRI